MSGNLLLFSLSPKPFPTPNLSILTVNTKVPAPVTTQLFVGIILSHFGVVFMITGTFTKAVHLIFKVSI